MNRFFLVIVMVLNLTGAAFANDANFRPKLGCVPFQATSLQAMAFTENISTSLLNYLDNSGFFDLVERKKIEQFSVVEGLSMDNLDLNGIIRIGTTARLDYVVYGSVNTSESSGVVLEVNLLRVSSKKLILNEKFTMSEADYSGKMLAVANSVVDHVRNAGKPVNPEPVKAPPLAVPPPDKVTASGTSSSIRLEWHHGGQSQIIGFNIYRANSLDGQYSRFATTTEPFFIDDNLKLNDTFYYRIAAVGQTGISEMTMPVKGATAIAPPAPIFMNVEADIKGARLIWRARPGNSDNKRMQASEYLLYRRQGEGTFSLIARLPVDAATYVDTGLSDGVKYIYTITSRNSEGTESEYSAKLSVQPLTSPGPVKAKTGRIRTISVSWDQFLGDAGAGYMLYRSDARDGRYAKIAKLEGLKSTGYTDTELMDNSTYWYRMSVYNKGGVETDPSEPVSALTRNLPPAPQQLTADGEARRAKLHWQLAGTAEDEIKRVIIFRSTEMKAGIFEKIAEVNSNQSEYVDRNPPLKDNTTYHYRVCSQNSCGAMSPDSESVTAITKAQPRSPAGLSATSGGIKKISLRWDRNPESDIKWYQIFRKQNDESDFTELKKTDNIQFEDTDLPNGAEVAYRIRAIDNDELISSFSDAVSARTKPSPAKVVGFKIVNPADRIVSWSANQEKDVHSYTIYKKGFLGMPKKLATIQGTSWKLDETRDKVEIYVTAVDDAGLESEASETLNF